MDSSRYILAIEHIRKELMNYELPESIGLQGGTSGIALFLAYYDRIIGGTNNLSPRIMEILEHNIETINAGSHQSAICNGMAGFGWLCEHLRKLGMLSGESVKFLNDIDPFLHNKMIADMRQGEYDYLYGAVGVASYFVSRFEKKWVPDYLREMLTELEKSSIECEDGSVKWISTLKSETGEKGYNISLSHGMSSIAALLIRLFQLNIETERVRKLLTGTVKYIIDQITYAEGSLSYFPSYSKESNSSGERSSRLGWCYGDLGVAHVLRRAAVVLENKEWEDTAITVLLHNSKRRELHENNIWDAGVCHGSSGIAHIFWNLYLNTGIETFKETTDYWLDVAIEMAKHPDGLAGYKAWCTERFGGYQKSYSLLTGISGIGLVFLSRLDRNGTTWDESLMLS